MRLFYEAWQILDPNSSVMTDESSNQEHTQSIPVNSSVMTDELESRGQYMIHQHKVLISQIIDNQRAEYGKQAKIKRYLSFVRKKYVSLHHYCKKTYRLR